MTGAISLPLEILTVCALALIVVVDLIMVSRRPHVPKPRELSLWLGFYTLLALAFAALLWAVSGGATAGDFVTGWLTEYSLSVDNLFVFLILFTRFRVPRSMQQGVLLVGIVLALILRAIFIFVGAELIVSGTWIFWIFGGFLIYTAIHQALRSSEDDAETEGRIVRWLRSRLNLAPRWQGMRLRVEHEGKRRLSPIILVFVGLAVTDVLFAFDSIPAIFGITTNAFIVLTANIFALLGLTQMYFLLGNLITRLVYLKYGIAVILAFIGVNLVLEALATNSVPFINGGAPVGWAPEIPTGVSLAVIIGSMMITTGASLWHAKKAAGEQGK